MKVTKQLTLADKSQASFVRDESAPGTKKEMSFLQRARFTLVDYQSLR